jgi:hypothetical protein
MRTLTAATGMLAIALALPVTAAAAPSGTAPFCLKTATGEVRCAFATMGECEQARPSTSAGQCITRSDAEGTTGLGERPRAPSGAPSAPGGALPER